MAKRGSPSKAKARSTGGRSGTPKQVGSQQVASLAASGRSAKPPVGGKGKSAKGGGYKGSPLVVSNPVNSGERAARGGGSGYPKVYGGGKQITTRKGAPKARGSSASGAAGAA
jgi:hypothetical protein